MGHVNIGRMGEDLYALDLKNLTVPYGCENATLEPTHVTHHSSTSIEVCITILNKYDYNGGILGSGLSDHLPIYICTQDLFLKDKRPTH